MVRRAVGASFNKAEALERPFEGLISSARGCFLAVRCFASCCAATLAIAEHCRRHVTTRRGHGILPGSMSILRLRTCCK
eukprot:15465796-Alexandrium_andersonii.AAC.1